MRRRAMVQAWAVGAGAFGGWTPGRGSEPWRVSAVELPPLIMATPSGSTGILVDLLRLLFARLGLPLSVHVVPWARAYGDAVAGHVAGVMPTIRSPERERELLFPSEPLYQAEMSFFKRVDVPLRWTGRLTEVQGLRIVKLKGALFAPEFDQAVLERRLRCEETHSFASAIRMVHLGRVDLAAVPKLAGLQIAASEGLSSQVLPLEPRVDWQAFHLALSRTAEAGAWLSRINTALAALHREGAISRLVEQYRERQWLPPA